MTPQVPSPNEQSLFMPGFGPIAARRMTLMSVHFEPKVCREFFHSNRRPFVIGAGTPDKPAYCHVYDSQQIVPDTSAMSTQEPGQPTPPPMLQPVRVETIVDDLLRLWSRCSIGVSARFPAGIILIAGETATAEEIKRAVELEQKLCRALVEEGDKLSTDPKLGSVEMRHRRALDWIGSEKRSWYHQIEIGRMKTGALTGTRIPMEALVDGGQNLLDFYVGYNLNPEDFGDTFVANLLKTKPELRKATMTKMGINQKDK